MFSYILIRRLQISKRYTAINPIIPEHQMVIGYRVVVIVEVVAVDPVHSLVLLNQRNFDIRVYLKLVLPLLAFGRSQKILFQN